MTNLHEFYLCCGECGADTWYIKMTGFDMENADIDGILCANPECDVFVENPGINFELE